MRLAASEDAYFRFTECRLEGAADVSFAASTADAKTTCYFIVNGSEHDGGVEPGLRTR